MKEKNCGGKVHVNGNRFQWLALLQSTPSVAYFKGLADTSEEAERLKETTLNLVVVVCVRLFPYSLSCVCTWLLHTTSTLTQTARISQCGEFHCLFLACLLNKRERGITQSCKSQQQTYALVAWSMRCWGG